MKTQKFQTQMEAIRGIRGAYWTSLKLFEAAGFVGDVDRLKAAAKDVDSQASVEQVLARYRDVTNQTLLHFASLGGKTHVCKYLIEELNLDVNAKDANGETPLMNATARGHLDTVMYLLQMGANPDLANKKTFSPLHYAANKGEEEMLHLLLSKGANVDPLSLIGSPLHMAASKANEEAVKILLDNGSNPEIIFCHVDTPLVVSVLAKSFCCLEHLIKAGADPNTDSCYMRPLAVAASEGEAEIVEYLLKAGAHPDAANKDGLAPIELAALKGNHQIVQILYPVTSKISRYPDWSIDGIMKGASSARAKQKFILLVAEAKNYVQMKMDGDKAFKDKDYDAAINLYTKYLQGDTWEALCKRGQSFAHLNYEERALIDVDNIIKLNPNRLTTFIRAGLTFKLLGKYGEAADMFLKGLKKFPENILLRQAYEEAAEAKLSLQKQNLNTSENN